MIVHETAIHQMKECKHNIIIDIIHFSNFLQLLGQMCLNDLCLRSVYSPLYTKSLTINILIQKVKISNIQCHNQLL